ncbi:helix-turn-helix domain-containing protein [Streptomyces sp. NPDC048650]|uniref:helix-turn-helix domain-containing protein n=1 Tax=Streptomyces sp. NPDC048650 TaxID=3365583 RepID=UPI003719C931
MHGELGYSLKDIEGRLPASRSSLSRYLRGQSLPDERLLVQWCKLSFTGEDRLPALVELLHRALEAADTPPLPSPAPETGGDTGAGETSAEEPASRRRLPLVLAVVGTVAVLAAAAFAVPALTGSGADGPQGTAAGTGSARITVHNVERDCQRSRGANCALGLARDPYVPYHRSNVVGHVWHGDVLHARCRIANGITVTDEAGGHSSMWFQVDHDGKQVWMPGIRIRPEQLENSGLPACPD